MREDLAGAILPGMAKAKPPRSAGAAPQGGGREPHEPTPATRATVCDALARGQSLMLIARALGVGSVHTVQKRYAEEIAAAAQHKADMTERTVRTRAYGFKGPDGKYYPPSEPLLKELIRHDLGWVEAPKKFELSGLGGGPIPVEVKRLSDEELARALLAPAAKTDGDEPEDR